MTVVTGEEGWAPEAAFLLLRLQSRLVSPAARDRPFRNFLLFHKCFVIIAHAVALNEMNSFSLRRFFSLGKRGALPVTVVTDSDFPMENTDGLKPRSYLICSAVLIASIQSLILILILTPSTDCSTRGICLYSITCTAESRIWAPFQGNVWAPPDRWLVALGGHSPLRAPTMRPIMTPCPFQGTQPRVRSRSALYRSSPEMPSVPHDLLVRLL
jgi:hypothetical protein